MYRLLLTLLLTTLVYTAVPVHAQRAADRARITREIEETDRQSAETVREWLMDHRVPHRIHQPSGRVVELVGVAAGHPIYLVTLNRTAALVTRTTSLYPGAHLGLALTGSGLELGIWDGGHVRTDHLELTGRVTTGDASDLSDHATHVGGTLAASGIDARARGMAFGSRLKSYSWTADATEMSNEASTGMVISNHSYSIVSGWHYGDLEDAGTDRWYWVGDPSISGTEDYMFGRYDVPAVQFDRVVYTNPYFLPVVAAGNDRLDTGPATGPYRAFNAQGQYQTYYVDSRPIERDGGEDGFDTLGGSGVAKNVLTVGSVAYYQAADRLATSTFSSFGPTDDGRIKPDIMGLGEGVFSLSSDSREAYGFSSGTSMATPNVAGSLALLQQYHEDIYGSFMRAATLKGLAIHTARDLADTGPDFQTGWGLLDAEAAAEHLTASITNTAAIMEETLVNGDTYTRDLSVEAEAPMRVTLAWTDHPSTRLARRSSNLDDPAIHLRNDLDVRIVHAESGTEFLPYVLDRINPDRPAAVGDNLVDPVEQVYIPSAEPGRYVVTVRHKSDLYNDIAQDFSLIVSGAHDEAVPVDVARLTAEATLDGVTLRWSTLFEREVGNFEIERGPAGAPKSSGDDFVEVGSLAMIGNGARDYEFVDDWSLAGHYVYRVVFVGESDRFVAAETEVALIPPENYDVLSSYPNPFHDRTDLVVDLPRTQHVTLEIFDTMGRRVAAILDQELAAGRHRIAIEGDSWPAGVYFARIMTPNGVTTHQLVRM